MTTPQDSAETWNVKRIALFFSLAICIIGVIIGFSTGGGDEVVVLRQSPTLFNIDPEAASREARTPDEEVPSPVVEEQPADTDPLTIYVSPNGSDEGDGQTPATPFASLERAVSELKAGMTLFVMEGTHIVEGSGPTLLPLVVDRNADQWTRVLGFGDERPVIIARGGALFEALGSYIEISGLEIRGEGFGPESSYGYGILLGDGHHFRVVDNVVSGFPVGGIGAVRTSHLFIANNVVSDNSQWGTEQGSGLSVYHATNYGFGDDEFGYSDYFINNIVFGNENLVTSRFVRGEITDGNGIIIDNGDDTGYLGRTLVANNVIYDNGGRGIWSYISSRVDIFNNTVVGNMLTGEALNGARAEIAASDGTDVRIQNNVTWAKGEMGLMFFRDVDELIVDSNVGFGGFVDGYDGDGVTLFDRADGVFAGASAGSPELFPVVGSVLIDSGSLTASPFETDIAGNPRVSGAAIDIGAYEATAS